MTGRKAGFTLLEALIALVVVSALAVSGYLFIGRKLVDKGDPVRVAKQNGYIEPKVLERHDFLAWRHGCGKNDDVAFTLSVTNPNAIPAQGQIHVCCGAWFAGCRVAEK